MSPTYLIRMQSTSKKAVGAIAFPRALFKSCQEGLDEICTLHVADGAPPPVVLDAMLFALTPPLDDSLANFYQARRENPLIPFVTLASGVDANFASELLKCGADDFVLVPSSSHMLQHKVRRALGQVVGPAPSYPEFSLFAPRPFPNNQRRCFRVHVTPDFPVASRLPGPVQHSVAVKDLSIETEQGPGGLQLATDRATARELPFDQWSRPDSIPIRVQLPTGEPICARARLVPGLRNAPDGSVRFALEYWAERPQDKGRLRRYWMEAQRRMRRRNT